MAKKDNQKNHFRALDNFQKAVREFDHFIIDGWNLLHNGIAAYAGAAEMLSYLVSINKSAVFLVNSPRQGETIKNMLLNYGITPRMYDYIWTSGDQLVSLVRKKAGPFRDLNNKCYVIDNAFDGRMMHDANLIYVDQLEKASFVLMMSVDNCEAAHDQVIHNLEKAHKLKLPMFCPIPNTFGVSGDEIILKGGFYAYEYLEMGGEVHFIGKPSIQMFEDAHTFIGPVKKSSVAVIGDQIMTDIVGAMAYGFQTIFIMNDRKYADVFNIDEGLCNFQYDTSRYDQAPRDLPDPDFIVPTFRLSDLLEKTIHMGNNFNLESALD